MPLRSARTRPSATAPLSPKMSVLTASFIDRAGPERPEVEDPAREAVEDRAGALEVVRLAADHDRQLARRASTTTLPETGASRMPRAARPDGRRDRPDRVGQDRAHVDRDRAGPQAGGDAVRAVEQVAHGGVVGDHRDDDVRPRRGLGRGGRHARADPLGQRGRPVRRPVVDDDRRRPGRPAARPSPSPSGRCPGRRRSGRSSTAAPGLTRRRPSAAGRSRRCARPTARRGPRAPPPTAAGCAGS